MDHNESSVDLLEPHSNGNSDQPVWRAVQAAREKAGEVKEKAGEQVKTGLSTHKETAARELGDVAEALRNAGASLQENNNNAVSRYTDAAATQIEELAGYLRENDIDEIVRQAETWARTRPGLFIGGAFALGLMATRLFKNAAPQPAGSFGSGARLHSPSETAYDSGYASGGQRDATSVAGESSSPAPATVPDRTGDRANDFRPGAADVSS